ncbi:MAG: hypothetical protein N2691_01480 [Patescibacteria group bacterium]|nr:hypothetical protein [Patescibacteria group bacterium]
MKTQTYRLKKYIFLGVVSISIALWLIHEYTSYASIPQPVTVLPLEITGTVPVNPGWPELMRVMFAPGTEIPKYHIRSNPPLDLHSTSYYSISRMNRTISGEAETPTLGIITDLPLKPDTEYVIRLEPVKRSIFLLPGNRNIIRKFRTTASPLPPSDSGITQDYRLLRSTTGSHGRVHSSDLQPQGKQSPTLCYSAPRKALPSLYPPPHRNR